MESQIFQEMKGRWKHFLALECGFTQKQLSNQGQPCPLCGGEDRYNFDDKNGIGTYFCRKCGPGTGFSMLKRYLRISDKEAFKKIENYLNKPVQKKEAVQETKEGNEKREITYPAPVLNYKPGATLTLVAQNPKNKSKPMVTYDFQYFWEWIDPAGNRVGYIGRTESKITVQILHTLDRGWMQGTIGDTRPAFCSKLDSDLVIISEGEKDCSFVAKATEKYSSVTWVGGANGKICLKTKWDFLANKYVYLCPDNDTVGKQAMAHLYEHLKHICKVTIINPPDDAPDGWGIGDLAKDSFDFDSEFEELIEKSQGLKFNRNEEICKMIRPLGFLDGEIYFMHWHRDPEEKVFVQEIATAAAGQITDSALQFWGDWEDWKNLYGEKLDIKNVIAPAMIRACKDQGTYDETKIRGSGVWNDNGKIVFNAGNRLYIDYKLSKFSELDTYYIYQSRPPIVDERFSFDLELSSKEKEEILKVLCVFNVADWNMTLYTIGAFYGCVNAGRSPWRPHVYVEGKKGSGKSNYIRALRHLLGARFVESLQASATEAYIRQRLKCDARPVLFDESEAKAKILDNEREKINELKRAASTNDGGTIGRGGAFGKAQMFKPNFNMFEAGTAKPKNSEAGTSREIYIEMLASGQPVNREQSILTPYYDQAFSFEEAFGDGVVGGIIETWHERNIPNKFIATAIKEYDKVLNNFKAFKKIYAEKIDPRAGDTFGITLASAAAFLKGDIMENPNIIDQFIDQTTFGKIIEKREDEETESDLLRHIYQIPVVVEADQRQTFTILGAINEFVECKKSRYKDEHEQWKPYRNALGLYGIAIKEYDKKWYVHIPSQNVLLSDKLKHTPFAHNWTAVLKRLPGVIYGEQFTCNGQNRTRGVRLPFKQYFEYLPDDEPKHHSSTSEEELF